MEIDLPENVWAEIGENVGRLISRNWTYQLYRAVKEKLPYLDEPKFCPSIHEHDPGPRSSYLETVHCGLSLNHQGMHQNVGGWLKWVDDPIVREDMSGRTN